MRASVDSRALAQLHGARPDRSAALAWAIGCSLAALAGILIAPALGSLSHVNLTLLIVNAYAAAMFGRLRSLPMTFLGAVILGLADSYAIGYIPSDNQYCSSFRFVIPVGDPVHRAAGAAQPAAAHPGRPASRRTSRCRRGAAPC